MTPTATADEAGATFPSEVIDQIIDDLRGFPSDLRMCALTCRAWLPRVRYNLFHTIHIHNLAVLELLASTSRMPCMLPHFEAVHELVLGEPESLSGSPVRRPSNNAGSRRFVHLLQPLLPTAFRMTKILKIMYVDWRAFPSHPSSQLHGSMFSSVTELDLSRCNFGSFKEFVRLISAFPSLSDLGLHKSYWNNSGTAGADPHTSRPALRSLSISAPEKETDDVFDWMFLGHSSRSLRNLVLPDMKNITAGMIRRVFQVLGLHLESLQVVLWWYFEISTTNSLFSECTSLLSLTIRARERNAHRLLASHLSHVKSRRLRRLELTAETTMHSEVDLRQCLSTWKQVDDVLAGEQFASLETVVVTWGMHVKWTEMAKAAQPALQDQFPKLCERGILSSSVRTFILPDDSGSENP